MDCDFHHDPHNGRQVSTIAIAHHPVPNTIPRSLAADASSAIVAGAIVAPVVTWIDMAVTEVAVNPKKRLLQCLRGAIPKMFFQPHRVLLSRPSVFMFMLYAGTYLTANLSDSITMVSSNEPPELARNGLVKFGSVSTVNVVLSLAKDNEFAKTFGGSTTLRPLTPASIVPLLLRDAVTLFASFNLPAPIAKKLPESWDNVMSRQSIAQLAAPVGSQLVATPLHLWGLDIYNRRHGISLRERVQQIRLNMMSTTLVRMGRVLPGLGIGNIVNTNLRDRLS